MPENIELLNGLEKLLCQKQSKRFYANRLGITEDKIDELLRELRNQRTNNVLSHKVKINAKILLLDIETSPLMAYVYQKQVWKARIGHDKILSNWFMLTWAAKWLDDEEMFSDGLTPIEALNEDDSRISTSLWLLLDEADVIVAHNGCVAPGNKVLKSDFTWELVENLKVGDQLIGFQEDKNTNKGKIGSTARKYEISTVEYAQPIEKECSEIFFSDGTSIITSNDHPWLMRFSSRHRHWVYTNTDELLQDNLKGAKKFKTRDVLTKVLPTWDRDEKEYHAGYLAGFFDADGCLSQCQRAGRKHGFIFSVTFSQKDEQIIKKLKESLDYYKFKYSIIEKTKKHNYDDNYGTITRICLLGGLPEKLRFLGTVHPSKLKNLDLEKLQHLKMSGFEDKEIIKVVPIGIRTVIGLQTSSRTYIVNGFPCHNSKFDIPNINTRFVLHGLKPPSPYKQIDTLKVAQQQFGFTHNSLDALAAFFGIEGKTETNFNLWKACVWGDEEALIKMENYNMNDVVVLEKIYHFLKPYIKGHPNLDLYTDSENPVCPTCGNHTLSWMEGKYFYTQSVRYQIFRCTQCGAISRSKKGDPYINKKLISAIPR